jgi:hypothetical protein
MPMERGVLVCQKVVTLVMSSFASRAWHPTAAGSPGSAADFRQMSQSAARSSSM